MTTQSLPISKTKKDITIAVLVSLLIAGAGALIVYYSRPASVGHNPGLIMRQPRMTFVVAYAVLIGATAFTFLKRKPLNYISRVLAWSMNIVFAIGLAAFYFISDEKTKSWGFKGLLFVLTFSLSATLLTEAMVFYRMKVSQNSRNKIIHQFLFAIICAAFIGATGYVYTAKAVHGGAVLKYPKKVEVQNTVPVPSTNPSSIDPSLLDTTVTDPTATTPLDTTPTS